MRTHPFHLYLPPYAITPFVAKYLSLSLAQELNERLLKVDRLKQKFGVVAGRLAGLDQEEHSQAYYVIQAAQERESLQREGDQLNEAIKVAEKEIRLLQRTLQSLVIRNDNFRASFHKVCLSFSPFLVIRVEHLEVTQCGRKFQFVNRCRYERECVC